MLRFTLTGFGAPATGGPGAAVESVESVVAVAVEVPSAAAAVAVAAAAASSAAFLAFLAASGPSPFNRACFLQRGTATPGTGGDQSKPPDSSGEVVRIDQRLPYAR